MDAEIEKLLPLARHIARDFSDIPGLSLPEIEIHAQEALEGITRIPGIRQARFGWAVEIFPLPCDDKKLMPLAPWFTH